MKKRNFILIVALSLSLMFAAGCGENKSTGADNSADRQETSESTVQNEAQADDTESSGDTQQAETTDIADGTEAEQEAQSDYQVEMVSYKKTELVDISYPKITGWSNTDKQEE